MTTTSPGSVRSAGPALVDEETAARVALAAAGAAGNAAVSIGVRVFGSAARFVAAVHDQRDAAVPLAPPVRQRIRGLATATRVRDVLGSTAAFGLTILAPHHSGWPSQLSAMRASAPLLLWVQGDGSALADPAIAMTGTTSPTESETRTIVDLATGLSSRGWVLVAGASRGVESLALQSAEAMKRPWILVAATGLAAREKVSGYGVQVSEVPPGHEVSVASRRRANQLIVALAGKLIVDEAGDSSCSLPMIEAARAMGRPVGLTPHDTESADLAHRRPGRWQDVPVLRSIRDADWFH